MTQPRPSGLQYPWSSTLLQSVKLLWSEADRRVKYLIVITLLLVLVSSVVSGLAPLLLKVIVDRLEPTQAHTTYSVPILLVIAYSFSHWLGRSLTELRGMFHGRTDQRVQRLLSYKLFRHVMSLPLGFHLDRKTGGLSQTLANGLIGYRMVLHHLLLTVLPVVVEISTMCVVLTLLDQIAFLAIIGSSVLFYTVAFWTGIMRIASPARAVSNAHIDANAVLTDSILNYETVKYFGAEVQMQGRFCDALAKTEERWSKLFRRKTENGLLVAIIFALSLGISVYVAANAVRHGTMSVGEFVLVNAYIIQITRPLEMLGFAFRDTAQGIAFVEKICELLAQKQEVDVVEQRAHMPRGRPELVFDNVSYSYRPDRPVVQNINFAIPSGKTLAIVGASGSGKSSLIRLLVRLLEPTEGVIRISGTPMPNIPASALRRAIAVVQQDITLFNDSIAYNIGFGRQDSTMKEIVAAAKVAHIHDFIVELPNGYETQVGERGFKLSGGEKQRIAIARAAIRNPMIFVFDEATSSLDSSTEQAIQNDLMKVAKTTTTLIVAHRLSTVIHADEIVVLDRGSVIERGTHSELLANGDTYATMWNTQHHDNQMLHSNASIA